MLPLPARPAPPGPSPALPPADTCPSPPSHGAPGRSPAHLHAVHGEVPLGRQLPPDGDAVPVVAAQPAQLRLALRLEGAEGGFVGKPDGLHAAGEAQGRPGRRAGGEQRQVRRPGRRRGAPFLPRRDPAAAAPPKLLPAAQEDCEAPRARGASAGRPGEALLPQPLIGRARERPPVRLLLPGLRRWEGADPLRARRAFPGRPAKGSGGDCWDAGAPPGTFRDGSPRVAPSPAGALQRLQTPRALGREGGRGRREGGRGREREGDNQQIKVWKTEPETFF